MEANVVLMRCVSNKKLFGARIQKMPNGDWNRTWAFKINESIASREGYTSTSIQGSLSRLNEYPGCPYCGNKGFFQCGKCHKLTCDSGKDTYLVCSWCGYGANASVSNSFNVDTDAF